MLGIFCYTASWPQGSFAFPAPIRGCPSGFTLGCRGHDNEDWDNRNRVRPTRVLQGRFGEDITICYCVSTSPSSGRAWPAGRYCINAVGSTCPSGFTRGSVFWDDEDDSNGNSVQGAMPAGVYNMNTLMYYCCRSDGEASTEINLPSSTFILYQYRRRGCQKVAGKREFEVIVKFDDEDAGNDSYCVNGPYDPECTNGNHEIYMCLYP